MADFQTHVTPTPAHPACLSPSPVPPLTHHTPLPLLLLCGATHARVLMKNPKPKTLNPHLLPGAPPPGERPLYLLIQAPTEAQVRRAKQELRRVIEEYTEKAMRNDTGAGGRYSIV